MRLFHFSDDPGIVRFEPRPVLKPSPPPPGLDWLNGPLVWAIKDRRQAMYLFPRDCPRIVLWPTKRTTGADKDRFWRGGDWRTVAYVEEAWLDTIARAVLDEARARFPRVRVLSVTADPEVLQARLLGRGRETETDVETRVARAAAFTVHAPDVIEVRNDGPLEPGVDAFVAALAQP